MVISLGFRRSRLHPEMYAPRAATATQHAQSRARGLARAVLDTFPTFTWSSDRAANRGRHNGETTAEAAGKIQNADDGAVERDIELQEGIAPKSNPKDGEAEGEMLELEDLESTSQLAGIATDTLARCQGQDECSDDVSSAARSSSALTRRSLNENEGSSAGMASTQQQGAEEPPERVTHATPPVASPSTETTSERQLHQLSPAIEITTAEPHEEPMESMADSDHTDDVQDYLPTNTSSLCPICTDDFEDGDTVRVLPCAGRHHYHAACIDEWLTGHSVCPLCRFDFAKRTVEAEATPSDDNSSQEDEARVPAAVLPGATEDASGGGVNEERQSLPSNDNPTAPVTVTTAAAPVTATTAAAPVPRRWSALPSLLRPPISHRPGRPGTPASHFAAFRDYCSRKKAQRRERRFSSSSNGTSRNPSPSSTSRPLTPLQSHTNAESLDTAISSRGRHLASNPHSQSGAISSRTRSLRVGIGRSASIRPGHLGTRPRSLDTTTPIEERPGGLYDVDDLQRHVSDAHGLLWLL